MSTIDKIIKYIACCLLVNDYRKQYSCLTLRIVMKGTGKPVGLDESVRKGRAWFLNSSFLKLDLETGTVELALRKG